ncbi:MAG TPA: aromatic ring-hydroxylating dioxygenase subunit alpha, partial [Gammaproteobacteria bacterium]
MNTPARLAHADVVARPLEQAATLPGYMYADPAFHAFDAERIFARSWQLLCGAQKLANAGDHVVAEIAGKPVILVRGEEGTLRGFFNVCKHRAGPLALTDGNARQLQCKYHGWTYKLDGQLRAAHEMQLAKDFDIGCIHLDAIQVREWQGLVFACVGEPGVPLETALAGIRERIQPIDLEGFRYHSHVAYDVACDWKAYVDNYLEGYHLPHVHPGLNKLLDYRQYTTNLAEWYSWQQSPL